MPVTTTRDDRTRVVESPRRNWVTAYRTRAIVIDAVLAVVALAIALMAYGFPPDAPYLLASVVIFLAWAVALVLAGVYERRKFGVSDEEYRSVLNAFGGLVAVGGVLALSTRTTVNPAYFLTLVISLPTLTLAGRWVLRGWLRAQRVQGELMMRTVVVGRADSARALIASIRAEPHQGMDVVAVCTTSAGVSVGDEVANVPVLGLPRDTFEAAMTVRADAVALAADPDLSGVALRRLTWELAEYGIELIVAPGLLDVAGPRLFIRPSTNLSLLHVQPPAPSRRTKLLKAVIDFLGSALLLLVLSPVLIATAIAIFVTDPGPVLYRQVRVGEHGHPFRIFKFRTMVVDADKKMEALRHLSDGNAVQFKMREDPRITPVGRYLRKYSIDELPQLLNVLIGDMSLVGPRPQTQREVDLYEPDAMRRLNVRPGMTGLWQVSGRSDLNWEESVRLDLRYVDNLSLTLDADILLRTFKAVFGGGGAY